MHSPGAVPIACLAGFWKNGDQLAWSRLQAFKLRHFCHVVLAFLMPEWMIDKTACYACLSGSKDCVPLGDRLTSVKLNPSKSHGPLYSDSKRSALLECASSDGMLLLLGRVTAIDALAQLLSCPAL